MYIKIKNQKEIIKRALVKAGGYRRLAKIIKTPRSSLLEYSKGRAILEYRFEKILRFLHIKNKKKLIEERLPNNWKQIKGGIECVASKKRKGTFEKEMKKWQRFQARKLKKWHKLMKREKPTEYYNIQFSRFKKMLGYKETTKNGEKVRNIFEKQIADILFDLKIDYKYEPLVNYGKRYFFPDFVIDNKIIIECTMWKGKKNAYKLKDKIENLKNKYKIYVVTPKTLYRYYKILNNHLILGLDEFVPVAQSFAKERSNR